MAQAAGVSASKAADVPRQHVVHVGLLAVAVAALHVFFVRYSPGAILASDSMGYLGNARTLAGAGAPVNFDYGAFTAVGYGLLLAPAYLVTTDPHSVFLFAAGVNVAASAAISVAAYFLARDVFGVRHGSSLLIGALAATYPGYLLQSGQVWPEVVLAALVLWWVVFLARFLRTGTVAAALACGVVTGFAWATHRRMAALVLTALLTFAFAALKHRRLRVGAIVAGASTLVLIAGTYAVERWLKQAMWTTIPVNESSTGKLVRHLAPQHWGGDGLMALGETWYLTAASLGLAALGVAAFVRRATSRAGRADAGRTAATALLVALVGTIAIGALSLGYSIGRVDVFVYGRYVDEFAGALIAAAGAMIASSSRSLRRIAPLLIPAFVLLASAAVVYEVRGPAAFAGNVQKLTIPGVLGEQTLIEGRTVFSEAIRIRPITLVAVVASLLLLVLVVVSPRAAVAAGIVGFVGFAFIGARDSLQPFLAFWNTAYDCVPTAIQQRHGSTGEVAMDLGAFDPSARNRYQFLLPHYRFVYFDGARQVPPAQLVVASGTWAASQSRGFKAVTGEIASGEALWEPQSLAGEAAPVVLPDGTVCPAPAGQG